MSSHKYIKRTGTQGNYRYWYKLPDGRIAEGNDAQQKQGKIEHVKRLVSGRIAGQHGLNNGRIAEITGHDPEKVRSIASNVGTRGEAREEHHMHEAQHTDVNTPEYQRHVEAHGESGSSGGSTPPAAAAAPARPRRSRGVTRGRGLEPEGPSASESAPTPAPAAAAPAAAPSAPEPQRPDAGPAASASAAEDPREARKKELLKKLKTEHGLDLTGSAGAGTHEAQPQTSGDDAATARRMSEKLRSAGGSAAPAASSAPAADGNQFGDDGEGGKMRTTANGRVHTITHDTDTREGHTHALHIKGRSGTSLHMSTHPSEEAAVAESHRQESQHGGAPAAAPAAAPQTRDDAANAEHEHSTRMGLDPDEAAHNADRAAAAHDAAGAQPAAGGAASTPRPESHSTTPHGQELVRFDPDFAASEEATNKMVEQQQQGANPYLTKAADIFGRIMGDVQEPRKTKVRNMLNAIVKAHNESQQSGTPMSKDLVLAHYKAQPGNERARSLPEEDFERATFHSADEVIDNKPIDPEMERMKRGFAMKQFNRVKPYLKPSFLAGLGADGTPPPYPTFGDLKSWSEHKASGGGEKPSWAGTSRTALPREIHEAAHKGPDGKPMHAPGWMPLHLTPVWNYVAAKASQGGQNPYQVPAPREQHLSGQTGKVKLPNQAGAQEGILINALRKYVQQRGGAHQLIDIPKTKLMEVGKTHEDIFKGDDDQTQDAGGGMDKELANALKTKIIDPVALMPFVMKELGIKPKGKEKGDAKGSGEKPEATRKSIALVVDLDADYTPGETLLKAAPLLRKSTPLPMLVIDADIVKSRRIRRIQEELRARGL